MLERTPDGTLPQSSPDGERLARLERRLRLLLNHLAGPAVRARVEVEDLVQEVFVRALTAGPLPGSGAGDTVDSGDAGDTELWRFLTRLARNTVVDVARAIRAARRDGGTLQLAQGDWTQAGPRASQLRAQTWGPATRVEAGELEARLEARFRDLAPEHRRVIGLRQFEGLSAREAAARMGRSETAVHSLYRRALLAWQGDEILEDSGDESERGQRS